MKERIDLLVRGAQLLGKVLSPEELNLVDSINEARAELDFEPFEISENGVLETKKPEVSQPDVEL